MALTAKIQNWLIAAIIIMVLATAAAKVFHLRSYIVSHCVTAAVRLDGPGSIAYKAEVGQQSRRSQQVDGAVLFFGDSNTVALATSNISDRSENFGINGDTIEGLTVRIAAYRIVSNRAIVLAIGTNDVPDGLPHFEEKYAALLALLPQAIPIVIVAIPPMSQTAMLKYSPHGYNVIPQTNRAISVVCRSIQRCRYLDLFTLLENGNGFLQSSYDVGDGFHLSTAAYLVWVKKLNDLVAHL